MRNALVIALILGLTSVPLFAATAQSEGPSPAAPQEESYYETCSPEQLDNLLAPIALYPDPLLAQALLAATFADQVDEAARYVRVYGQNGIDDRPWDVSVKAVAHYPSVLYMMADQLDWTIAVGQAYVSQSTDVMASVQRLRAMAQSEGNLVTTPEQQVVVDAGLIYIWPAQPLYIYIPVYDPYLVYHRRWPGSGALFVSFGARFVIGVWLNYDCDWRNHRIYYTGWTGGGWIARSRPHIQINNIYVNGRYVNISMNREIVHRTVNFYNLNRFNSVHRNTRFDNHAANRNIYRPNPNVNNQVIQRNIQTGNPQLNRYRGYPQPTPAPPVTRPAPQPPSHPTVQTPRRPAPVRPSAPAGAPQPQQQPRSQPQRLPQPQSQARPQTQAQPGAFGHGDGNFDPRVASRRGQSSRAAERQPARPAPIHPSQPQSRPAPQQRPQGRSR